MLLQQSYLLTEEQRSSTHTQRMDGWMEGVRGEVRRGFEQPPASCLSGFSSPSQVSLTVLNRDKSTGCRQLYHSDGQMTWQGKETDQPVHQSF